MDAKDSVLVFVLLLLSLGLFGSLSLTYCVWNKQTEVTSELQNELVGVQSEMHELQKRSELADIKNELHSKLQGELKNELHQLQSEMKIVLQTALNSREHLRAREASYNKDQLKRNVRQANEDTDTPSATEILTNALTEIIERKLVSYMNCDKNEYNHTKCTLKPGPKGEPGPEGPTGDKGMKGEPGDMGHKGEPGNKGMKGNPGFTGYKGEKGKEGVVGPQGPPGPTGPQGPHGMQGEAGERGEVGRKGEPGNKGVKGNPGFTGYKGEKGVVGPQGPPGPIGPQGPSGIQGKDGQKGEQGPLGPKGYIGPRGSQGHAGHKGDKGEMGERGLKGDMGPPGPQGETGERGDMGQKGEPGDKGMEGNQGSKGEKGEQGVGVGVPCGGPGWRRVVLLNMTNSSHVCPTGLANTTYSRRTCGRAHSGFVSCSSTTFSVGGSQYSRVCGRALAYRFGFNFAFAGQRHHRPGVEGQYVDGLSLTHGAPGSRQHIWTFASGWAPIRNNQKPYDYCPCDNGNTYPSPPFVGNDYFCESVLSPQSSGQRIFYPNATLWDGQVCEGGGTCCRLNNPPWFTKSLTSPTTEDIELRLCLWDFSHSADIALEQLELYVQ